METDITKHEGDNLGGVNSFRYLPIEAVEEMPDIFEGAIHTELVVKPLYRWFNGYCTEETMDYQEEQVDSDQGASFKRTFTGQVPKDRSEITALMNTMKNRRYLLEITYNTGDKKLVGSVEEPMYFRSKFTSKKQVSGRNEHDIAFTGDSVNKAPFYNI